jgi:DNA replication protein DnaC
MLVRRLVSLPERIAYARKAKLSEENFLELVLQDEIDRRDQHNLTRRLEQANFAEEQTLENFDWDAPVSFDRHRVRELFGLGFIERHEDVLFMGPTGVGKTFLASAVGHAACRAGYNVLFVRADSLFKQLNQARADHSQDKLLRRLLGPELLSSTTLRYGVWTQFSRAMSTSSSSSATDAARPSSPAIAV